MVAPAIAVALVPDSLAPADAAPLMCAGITTFNALRNSGARGGDLVAVLGLEGLGHLGVQYSVKMGFKTVGIARAFFVAHSDQEKETALDNRLAAQQKLVAASGNNPADRKASILTFEDTREGSQEAALIGKPDEIAAKIEKLKGMGVEYLLLNGGGSRENLRRFAREVIPSFAKQSVAAE